MADIRLSGQIAIDSTLYPALQNIGSPSNISFICQLQVPLYLTDTPQGDTIMCLATSGRSWSILLKDPLVYYTTEDPAELLPPPNASTTFIILDMLSMMAIRNGIGANHVVQTIRNDGPWAMVTNGSDVEAMRVTACMTNLGSKTVIADINSSSDNLEPEISWDRQAQSYDTKKVRRQLEASTAPDSSKDRGVLTLGPKSQWQTFETIQFSDDKDLQKDMELLKTWFFLFSLETTLPKPMPAMSFHPNNTANSGVILSKREGSAHPTHMSIFQGTLNDTESPALAVQALLARIHQMSYYEELVKQETTAVASTLMSSSASMPMRWTGFIIGTAIILSHLIIVATITAMFIKYTNYSCIGSYWQAVSQVISEDTRPVLEQANKMKDNEIKLWAKQQLLDAKSSTFLRYRQDGRVSLGISEHCE
jgi:hypothetical protein